MLICLPSTFFISYLKECFFSFIFCFIKINILLNSNYTVVFINDRTICSNIVLFADVNFEVLRFLWFIQFIPVIMSGSTAISVSFYSDTWFNYFTVFPLSVILLIISSARNKAPFNNTSVINNFHAFKVRHPHFLYFSKKFRGTKRGFTYGMFLTFLYGLIKFLSFTFRSLASMRTWKFVYV